MSYSHLGIIYRYTNKINKKIYIGKTNRCLKVRMNEHKCHAFRNNDNTHFHNALRKYGIENFYIDILFQGIVTKEELNKKEEYYIKKYDTRNTKIGYNITKGGDGNRYIDFDTEKAFNLYKKYNSAQKVSEILNVKCHNIYGLLRDRGISINGKHIGKKVFVYNLRTNKIKIYNRSKDLATHLIKNKISFSSQLNLEQHICKKKDTNKIVFDTYKFYSNEEGALKNVI